MPPPLPLLSFLSAAAALASFSLLVATPASSLRTGPAVLQLLDAADTAAEDCIAFFQGCTSTTSDYIRSPLGPQPQLPLLEADGNPAESCSQSGAEQVHLQVGHDPSVVIVTWSIPSATCQGEKGLGRDQCGVWLSELDGNLPPQAEVFVPCDPSSSLTIPKGPVPEDDTALLVRYSVLSGLAHSRR